MICNINELYVIKGQYGIYEFEAIKTLPSTQVRRAGARPYGKTIKVIQADGSKKIAYMYGEKTWSYDEEEINRHREACQKVREEARRRKLLTDRLHAVCDKMTLEEFEKFIEKIEKTS